MSLKGLKEAILSQARKEAGELTDKARQQTEAEERRILERARAIEEEIIRDGEAQAAQRAQQLRQQAELTGRADVLRAKEEEIEKTKQALLKQLYDEDAAPLIKKLLALVPDEAGVIVPGQLHEAILRKAAKGKDVAKTPIPNEGGFIFRGKTAELNVTVSHLVDQVFKKHRAQIASVLFG